MLNWTSNL